MVSIWNINKMVHWHYHANKVCTETTAHFYLTLYLYINTVHFLSPYYNFSLSIEQYGRSPKSTWKKPLISWWIHTPRVSKVGMKSFYVGSRDEIFISSRVSGWKSGWAKWNKIHNFICIFTISNIFSSKIILK